MNTLPLTVNGAVVQSTSDSLVQLLAAHGVDPEQRFVAISVNEVVVPRADWARRHLSAGDRIEIVQPIKGG